MVEAKLGPRTMDLPYTIQVPGVTEAMFDKLVDGDTKAELINGVMIVHSPTSLRHDDIGGFLRSLMHLYAAHNDLGKVLGPDSLIHLATCQKFAPDIFFLSKHRLPKKQFEGAPNKVIEVLSPSTRQVNLEEKRPAYREAGVGELWFVDPDKHQVIVDLRRKRTYVSRTVTEGRIESTVLHGFWVEAAWLRADPLPNEWHCLRQILGETG
jgi:Uma2 family endonuclease